MRFTQTMKTLRTTQQRNFEKCCYDRQTVCVYDTVFAVSIETPHEDDRYRKPVIRPFMIPIDHPPPPRDRTYDC